MEWEWYTSTVAFNVLECSFIYQREHIWQKPTSNVACAYLQGYDCLSYVSSVATVLALLVVVPMPLYRQHMSIISALRNCASKAHHNGSETRSEVVSDELHL
jgi:hypothetical protein